MPTGRRICDIRDIFGTPCRGAARFLVLLRVSCRHHLSLLRDPRPRPDHQSGHVALAPASHRPRLGGAARGRDRLPLARHQHHHHQAHGVRHRRHVRRLRRRASSPPGKASSARKSFTFIEVRHHPRHRRAGRHGQPARRGARGDRHGRRLRGAAPHGGLQIFFGEGFDPALYRMLLFGVAMVGIMVWRPRGIVGTRAPSIALESGAPIQGSGQRRPRMRRWQTDPLLKVEHLTMRFGGLLAVDDVSFEVGRSDITALIGPNGAGKTTVFNCITGFYKPTEGLMQLDHPDGRASCWSGSTTHDINAKRPRRPHLPEHPAVPRHDRAGEPDGGAAQRADARLGLHRRRPCSGSASFNRAETRRASTRRGIGSTASGCTARADDAGRRAALWRAAPARDRARHVHAARAALPRRAGGGPQRARERRAERAAAFRSATRKASRSC